MDNKPLSHIMSDSSHAVDDALETLGNAIREAINTHFDAGIQVERERIIKLLENSLIAVAWEGIFWNKETMGESFSVDVQDIIALIKGEK